MVEVGGNPHAFVYPVHATMHASALGCTAWLEGQGGRDSALVLKASTMTTHFGSTQEEL